MPEEKFPSDRAWVSFTSGSGTAVFVETGSVRFDKPFFLNGSDDRFSWRDVALHVGPYFRNVLQVAPAVFIKEWENLDSDDDDQQGYRLSAAKWLLRPYGRNSQVILNFSVGLKGEASGISAIGYHVTIEAEQLMQDAEMPSGQG